jgi:glycerol-3-phosphate acyltransferase PlsY
LSEKYIGHFPHGDEMVALAILLAILIPYVHRSNIARFLRGKENKLGAKA